MALDCTLIFSVHFYAIRNREYERKTHSHYQEWLLEFFPATGKTFIDQFASLVFEPGQSEYLASGKPDNN